MGWFKVGQVIGSKVIKSVAPQVKKTVTGLKPKDKASIYKTIVAPYVKKWSGKKGDKPSGKK